MKLLGRLGYFSRPSTGWSGQKDREAVKASEKRTWRQTEEEAE